VRSHVPPPNRFSSRLETTCNQLIFPRFEAAGEKSEGEVMIEPLDYQPPARRPNRTAWFVVKESIRVAVAGLVMLILSGLMFVRLGTWGAGWDMAGELLGELLGLIVCAYAMAGALRRLVRGKVP
jgi:hypothetical protein